MNSSEPKVILPGKTADQKFCFACGHLIHNTAINCPSCGAPQGSRVTGTAELTLSANGQGSVAPGVLPANHVYCRGCGCAIHETAHACPKCGAPQQAAHRAQSGAGRSREVAAVLAILLGGIGAHKFYLGSIFIGLLYLLFFWTAIPALIGLIEGVYYLTLSNEEFSRRYGG